MDQPIPDGAVSTIRALEEVREFLLRHREAIDEGRIEELRSEAASIAPSYRYIVARLARVRARTGLAGREADLSGWMKAIEPLFAPPQDGWFKVFRAAAL